MRSFDLVLILFRGNFRELNVFLRLFKRCLGS